MWQACAWRKPVKIIGKEVSAKKPKDRFKKKFIQQFWWTNWNLKRWNGNIFRCFDGLRLSCQCHCVHSFISRLQISEKIVCINIFCAQVLPLISFAMSKIYFFKYLTNCNCYFSLCLADTFQLTLLPFKIDSRYYRACWRFGAIGCHIHNCFTNFNLFVSIFFLGNKDYKLLTENSMTKALLNE